MATASSSRKQRVSPLVNVLLLPLFFTYTGLRTDVGSLGDGRELLLCLGVIGVAFAGKLGGVYVGARLVGESRREALTIATCMNTRALMELVALNIGLDLGVLPPSMFTKLVLMAIVSTFVATPLIRWLTRGQARPTELAAA
jgi:Kef-type K+ transport system membrane component KefB